MYNKFTELKNHIIVLANDEKFLHHKWFVDHHLNIVEQLANELCDLYPNADRDIVTALVWLHDIGKILTNKQTSRTDESTVTFIESRILLEKFGFPSDFIEKIISNLKLFEQAKEVDLSKENIEVQITSTADGCSHFVGPFMALHWYECNDRAVKTLVEDNIRKATKSWQRKITLPEAKRAFQDRYNQIMECGQTEGKKFFI